ncbi:MAG TPA: glutaredoxin family protein [Gallionella sp.]|nr:glutaredoxin family protein [Gallionella sp.]
MSPLVLYGTSGCHLCAAARVALERAGVSAVSVDIAEEAELLERYGMRIPVLRRIDDGAELGWPFDRDAVERFVA